MSILPKAIHKSNVILIKTPMAKYIIKIPITFFSDLEKSDAIIHMETQEPPKQLEQI